jgi:CubicO group peptidase (beta-lactamase class C family)
MKKKVIRFFLGFLTLLVVITLLVASYLYFRVDNRVETETIIPPFKNNHFVSRLDSTTLSPDSITTFLNVLMDEAHVQGLALSIVNNNELVYQNYFGTSDKRKNKPFKPGTIFYGASFSKTIFADIILQLAEDNLLNLDTPLYHYLPKPLYTYKTNFVQQLLGATYVDYSDLQQDERYKKITARMCLSHTTGLPNWRWLENDRKLKIKYEPGTRYSYSGEGMLLLQCVIEELNDRSIEDIAIEKIFIPLHMTRSSYVWQRAYEGNYCIGHDTNGNYLGIPKNNVPNAAGSLSTTLEDYTTYFMNVLSQKKERYHQLITPQALIKSKQQFGPNSLIDTNDNDGIQLGYGLGFGLYETPYGQAFFKEGHLEGWQHYAVGFPEQGMAMIIMSNSDNAEGTFKSLLEFCMANPYTPWYWEGYIPYNK